jgi:hypothetical protein
MDPVALEQSERLVVAHYVRSLQVLREVELFAFRFGAADAERAAVVKIARIELSCSNAETLWFFGTLSISLSKHVGHHNVFIGIYDCRELFIGELVACMMHFDAMLEPLDVSHTVPLAPSSPLRSAGYVAAVILRPGLYPDFDGTNEDLTVGDLTARLLSVVPLKQEEWDLKRAHGLHALLDEWDRAGRDVLHIERPSLPAPE